MKLIPFVFAAAAALVPVAAAAQGPTGAALYGQACAACHQPAGKGIPGAFPALDGDALVNGPAEPLAYVILNGRGGMPAFAPELDDATLSSILTYVRGAWGNKAPPIPAAVFTKIRGDKTYVPPPVMQAH